MKMWSPVPALGRNIRPEECAKGERVIMLGYSLWQRAFGGSPDIVNRVINADGIPCTVIGVIAPDFARYGSDIEFWVPLLLTEQQRKEARGSRNLQVNAKLKPGVTLAQAQAELDVIAANLAREHPGTNKNVGLLVRDLGTYINRSLAPMLYILLGAVGCVLLIACANVANLLLARATVRQREISIRTALGAGRGRLVRQLLAESMLLAALGGGLGILLAQWGLRFIRIYGPTAGTDMARMAFIELDPTVLAFTLGFSLLTGVVFGLAPAWLGSRVDLTEALKQGSRGSPDGGLRGGLRGLLVMLEVALALLLLSGAGLLLKSFARLAEVDPGFTPARIATMQLVLNTRKYGTKEKQAQFADGLLERIRTLPGFEAAGISNLTPFNNTGAGLNFGIVGRPGARPQPAAVPYLVSADYFKTMGIRLVRGRLLNAQDGVSSPLVFVINQTLARQYFPDEEPVGKSLLIAGGKPGGTTGEIVGVVTDVMQGMPGEPPLPQFYLPWVLFPGNGFNLSVRTTTEPATVLPLIKERVFALDRDQPVSAARTMSSLMNDKLARTHVMLGLLGIYALIALVIAAVGIYGVMAYSVSQRTMEFGIRMALGASRADVLGLVLRRGMLMVAAGLVTGLGAALALGKVVQSLLFNTSPRDPLTLAAIVLLLVAVSFIACLLPARRATKVDPMVALRSE
jgi:putative ABC transport system permease protein